MQGIQYTATSTVAENQTLSYPAYLHSIPTNNDNQDLVSMGSNAALRTNKIIDNSFQVLAVHCLALAEAIDALGKQDVLSTQGKKLYLSIRHRAGKISEDKALYKELASIATFLKDDFTI